MFDKLQRVSVRFPVSEYNQIKHDAKRQGTSMAEFLRQATVWYLANYASSPYTPTKAEAAAIRKGRAAMKRGDSVTLEQLHSDLLRRRQTETLKAAAGTWKDVDQPELKRGSAQYVRKLRRECEQRFREVTRQESKT